MEPNSSGPNKRQRANTNGESRQDSSSSGQQNDLDQHGIAAAVKSFDNATVRRLLTEGAAVSPNLAKLIHEEHLNRIKKESQKIVDFDYLSKSVWKEVNITHSSKKGSYQFEVAFEVSESVSDALRRIVEQITVHSNFQTKSSGLETLRKIGKTICLSPPDVIGSELRKSFERSTELEDSMSSVIKRMTDEERKTMCNQNSGEFVEKVKELIDLAEGYEMMSQLPSVLSLLEHGRDDDEATDSGAEGTRLMPILL